MAQTPAPESGDQSQPVPSPTPAPIMTSGSTQSSEQPTGQPVVQSVAGTGGQPVGRAGEVPGVMGVMARNTKILAWFQLVAALLLLYFSVQGFASGGVYFPFGFGLMGLYFLYGYVRNGLKVDFGSLTTLLSLGLMLGALVCLVLGIQNEPK